MLLCYVNIVWFNKNSTGVPTARFVGFALTAVTGKG